MIEIHTDGSCLENPGNGGWAAIININGNIKKISGSEKNTTNNRMELMAAIMGLDTLTRPMTVELYTDSRYVMNGVQNWLPRWKANGWRTAAKKPVANQDLWQQLDAAVACHTVHWHWVKGHSGNSMNERCDVLARSAAEAIA